MKSIEQILLKNGEHFPPEAAKFITECWDRKDIVACAGCGKTTVLLAKLIKLSSMMLLPNNQGACIISHTNAAVDEIKLRLPNEARCLKDYPNFIGTVHSFARRFVLSPTKRRLKVPFKYIGDEEYQELLLKKIVKPNSKLISYIKFQSNLNFNQYDVTSTFDTLNNIRIKVVDCGNHFEISIRGSRIKLNKTTVSGKELEEALTSIKKSHIISHNEALKESIEILQKNNQIKKALQDRFKYIFVDESQDFSKDQMDFLNLIFKDSNMIMIGDTYQRLSSDASGWQPISNDFALRETNRFGPKITDFIKAILPKCPLSSSRPGTESFPVIIIPYGNAPKEVIDDYVYILKRLNMHDPNEYVNKVVGYRKYSDAGITLSSFEPKYDKNNQQSESSIQEKASQILKALSDGRIGQVSKLLKELILNDVSPEMTDHDIPKDVHLKYLEALAKKRHCDEDEFAGLIADYIHDLTNKQMDKAFLQAKLKYQQDKSIELLTIHASKGQTHDTTLYLSTKYYDYDFSYILGTLTRDKNFRQHLGYVAMTRPKKLLCIALTDKELELLKKTDADFVICERKNGSRIFSIHGKKDESTREFVLSLQ